MHHTSLPDIASLAVNGEVDLRHLSAAQQGELLRSIEIQHRALGTIDNYVYLVGKNAREVLNAMSRIELGLHDVDGTHTIVGGHRLHPENVDGLKRAAATGVHNVAVTGRHRWQVEEIVEKDPDAFDESLLEQGFYRRRKDGTVELFEGTEAIAHNVEHVRATMAPYLGDMEKEHGVRFETTSLRGEDGKRYPHAHKTMYSLDALRSDGLKIDDLGLHERIQAQMKGIWRDQDPAFAIAKPGTSSTGTFEFTPDGLDKEGAVRRYLIERGVPAEAAAYFGDSSNDLSVFHGIPQLSRFVVVNSHTKDSLIESADVATVGTANAKPVLDRLVRAREEAKAIIIR